MYWFSDLVRNYCSKYKKQIIRKTARGRGTDLKKYKEYMKKHLLKHFPYDPLVSRAKR